ncbi:MAG: hypothetical protein KA746_07480 [Pyrinomonadaceae bacterium]|nr:hypothetical protein [Pyrinomonadaceae bacterium]
MKHHRVVCVFLGFILLFAQTGIILAQKTKAKPKSPPTVTAAPVRITKLGSVTVSGGETPLNMTPAQQLRWDSFIKIWQTLRDNYFDQTFNNLDWDKIKLEYKPKVVAAKTDIAFHAVMQEMIDRLGKSHFAIVPAEVFKEIETAKTEARAREKWRLEAKKAAADESEEPEPEEPLFDEAESQFGIGVELRLIDKQFVITRFERNSAAEYAGVKVGYVIDKINGVSLSEMVNRISVYYSFIRNFDRYLPQQIVLWFLNGEKDSEVSITCLDADDKPVEFKIRRERIKGQTVSIGANLPEQYLKFDSFPLNDDVGYMRFSMFALPVVEKFCASIAEHKDKKAIIIDLRGNVGGIIGTMYAISGMLSDKPVDIGTLIYKVGSEKMIATSKAKNYKGRVVVLVDGQSVSAAELFASALQENGRAVIVGDTTAGEALPAMSVALPTGGVFMYPFANFKTRSGTFLEGLGVKPDFQTSLDRRSLLAGTDTQLQKALSLIAESKTIPASKAEAAPPPAAKTIDVDSEAALPPPPKAVPKKALSNAAPGTVGIGSGIGTGSAPAPPAPVRDARSVAIINDYLNAIGGRDGWNAIKTYSVAGTQRIGYRGSETVAEFRAFRQDPDKYTLIFTTPVVGDVRQIVNGKVSVRQSDFGIDVDTPVPRSIKDVDIFSTILELLDHENLVSLEFQGAFDRDGRRCNIIQARSKIGATIGLAFDVETKMLVSYADRYSTTEFGDYRRVGALTMPHLVNMGSTLSLFIDKIEINQPIDEAYFKRKENCFDKPLQ